MSTILIIDDEAAIRDTLDLHFRDAGHEVILASTADEGADLALSRDVDLVGSDIRTPGARDGLSLLREVTERRPGLPVIIMTAYHDFENTIAAMQGGAVDYIPKPIDLEKLDAAVEKSLSRVSGEGALAIGQQPPSSSMVGRSAAISDVFKSIGLVARSRTTVLVLGESGTGKEVIARAIHGASPERDQPFVAINCAALVETLLESELFGHERGAFTGAHAQHRGKIEMVGEGTLFLDEVAELSPAMQGKLLRVLEAREYTPVGSTTLKKSSARFIAATNVDLAERVRVGQFREDLYYRLNVVTIRVPPLRERREDIPQMVDHLLRRINRDLRKNIREVSGDLMRRILDYAWPGNVRELDNVLMRAAVMARGDVLTAIALPEDVALAREHYEPASTMPVGPEGDYCSLRDVERRHVEAVLVKTKWHKGRACDILGITRPTLERKIREYGLVAPSA
ncbi:sigma-54-dependent transcriptional regulator [Caenispirillum salinarum]|uniref:sigma-54-dependent transcriptional regulator n=1 Tax=Caenispirillum salinarum TaxID=859058 RepID=UPI00384BC5AB